MEWLVELDESSAKSRYTKSFPEIPPFSLYFQVVSYTYDDTDRSFYGRVYDLLVQHAGAMNGPHDKESFVRAFTQVEYKATEYRCCHALGFGGKFWRNAGRFYVSCYPEDRSIDRDATIARINKLLEDLATEMTPLPYGPVAQ